MELFEIVMKLVGSVRPTGSHEVDTIRLENLKKLTELTDRLLGEINRVADDEERFEISMAEMGKYARNFINDVKDA